MNYNLSNRLTHLLSLSSRTNGRNVFYYNFYSPLFQMISSPAIILQRFSSFSRVLISNPASRNILPVKPAPQSHSFRILQNKCCCTFSSLYQSNSLNVLQERVSQLNVFADQSRGKSSKSSNRRRVCSKSFSFLNSNML